MLVKILIIILSHVVAFVICQSLRPGNEPMLFIGIFHRCLGNSTQITEANICRETINHVNLNKKEIWNLLMRKWDLRIDHLMTANDFQYLEFQFCDTIEAINIGIDVRLNGSYFVQNGAQNPPLWNKNKIHRWRYTSKILHILINAPKESSKALASMFYRENIPVTLLNEVADLPLYLRGSNLQTSSNNWKKAVKNIVTQLFSVKPKIQKFVIIIIGESLATQRKMNLNLANS